MRARWGLLTLVLLGAAWAGPAHARPDDRLARFRELAREYSRVSEGGDAATGPRVLGELYALADSEILENLRSGGPFASVAFIQERLDAFTAAWGGATFSVRRVQRVGRGGPLTLGVFAVGGPEPRGSLRVYGGSERSASLLTAIIQDATPEIHPWPPARDGALQVVVSWLGASAGGERWPLAVELWRQGGPGGLARTWASTEAVGHELWVSAFGVKDGQLLLRYDLRYPGWKPGCAGQTEQEDIYRQAPGADTLVLARRRVLNGWHRELQATVTRFFAALAEDDGRRLAQLVPDRALRARLPRDLHPEPACEERSRDAPGTAIVAATEERDQRLAPWSLWWSRGPHGWRLARAEPVLQ